MTLALAGSYAGARASDLQSKIEAARRKSAELQARLHQKRGQLNSASERERELQTQLDATNAAIGNVNAQLSDLNYQAASTQRKIEWNTIQLQAAQRSLKLHDDALNRRLVDIYENGDLSYMAVLLSAHSFTEFVERWQDLQLLINANETAVRERKAAAEKVASVQADLQRVQMQLQQEQQAQERAKNQLAAL